MHAVINCFQFKPLINDKDRKILEYLSDVRVVYSDNNNFTLEFYFSNNEFFDHDKLTKTYLNSPKTGVVYKIDSTDIQWKSEDFNPTIEKKKKKIKKKNEIKTITKVEEIASFFSFFKSYEFDETKEKAKAHKEGEDEEDEEEDMLEIIEDEYDLGLFVKDDFIPLALEYYLGINPEEPADDENEEEEEESDDDGKNKKVSKKHIYTKNFNDK